MGILTLFILLIQLSVISAYIKFTNLQCVVNDKPFVNFRQCQLKALSRNTVALSLHAQLFQVPINNITVNLDVYKRANGYHPFMYNTTADFCGFLKNKKRFPVVKLVMDIVENYSNINHTCPYDHDIIVKDMILKTEHLKLLPVPTGDYLLKISFAAYNDYKATIKFYVQIAEK
ncbi:uncharacterized protein LOC128921825 [Zeugodacus cucurbitae]|uniref:uncharacterized protein LOC128921825 n=1 Tax=Zeugodacus cucurbitae TaxID=28588 RepID=UPI0023D9166F|nr:uncharacterized protein LOC128921825 [Zeugodacus cucurbitae]